MTQHIDAIILYVAILLFVTTVIIHHLKTRRTTMLMKGFMTSILIILVTITVIQGWMIFQQNQSQQTTSNNDLLSNEQFFSLLTYDERYGDDLSMQTSELAGLATSAQTKALRHAAHDFEINLKERIASVQTLIQEQHLTAQQTKYLTLYMKGLTYYKTATKHFARSYKDSVYVEKAKRQLANGVQVIERAQVIINAM